jgi:hypothetical protein
MVPLKDTVVLPTSSRVDTTKGAVRLDAATRGNRIDRGSFRGGAFRFTQSRGRRPITQLTLGRLTCVAKPAVAAARKRRLFASVRGRFRTRGRYSATTVRGTKWLTKDSCGGTLTLVQQGTVVVRDLVKDRSVTLDAGERYLARPRNR